MERRTFFGAVSAVVASVWSFLGFGRDAAAGENLPAVPTCPSGDADLPPPDLKRMSVVTMRGSRGQFLCCVALHPYELKYDASPDVHPARLMMWIRDYGDGHRRDGDYRDQHRWHRFRAMIPGVDEVKVRPDYQSVMARKLVEVLTAEKDGRWSGESAWSGGAGWRNGGDVVG